MNRSHYPTLRDNPRVIHLDSSAAFPLHEKVVDAVDRIMHQNAGTPSKASYDWAVLASNEVDTCRTELAQLLGTVSENVFFNYSATDGFRSLLQAIDMSSLYDQIVYSPEDHDSVVKMLAEKESPHITHLVYGQDGKIIIPNGLADSARTIFFISHIHPLYGRINNIADIRKMFPLATIIVDASQSIGRGAIDVNLMGCDALFFSAQKLGGIPGVGGTYLSEEFRNKTGKPIYMDEPHTLPIQAICGLRAAISLLQDYGPERIEFRLSKLTNYFIEHANRELPAIAFAKGPAYSQFTCNGYGIVSFKINGYSSEDVAMILNDHHINVRAADHCVSQSAVDRDVVRVSMYLYTSTSDIDRLVSVLKTL